MPEHIERILIMSEMYFGRGNASMRDDYLDFINLVFGFNGNERDFMKILPNLYKEEYDPCYNRSKGGKGKDRTCPEQKRSEYLFPYRSHQQQLPGTCSDSPQRLS